MKTLDYYLKMRKLIFLMILASMLMLSSCTQSNTSGGSDIVHIGSQGVEITFVQNNPPSRIYAGEPLNVIVELANKGAYPNPDEQPGAYFDGKLYLGGYDTSLIEAFTAKQLPSDFYGKDKFNTEGGLTTVNFQSGSVNLPAGTDSSKQAIQATICYRYQTIATASVCIDPDPYSTKVKNKVCNINQISMSSTQGAPIAVSKVETDVLSSKIRFKIYVSNVGGGSVFDGNSLNKCMNLDKYDSANNVVYVSGQISGTNIACQNNGQVNLRNGNQVILCDAGLPAGDTAYRTPLNLKLDYAYKKDRIVNFEIMNTK